MRLRTTRWAWTTQTAISWRPVRQAKELAAQPRGSLAGTARRMPPETALGDLHLAVWWLWKSWDEPTGQLPDGAPFAGMDHLAMLAANAAHQLFAAAAPPPEPRPDISWSAGHELIAPLVTAGGSVDATMADAIGSLRGLAPGLTWDACHAIDFEKEIASYRGLVTRLVREQPPPQPIRGLWFGLFNPIYHGLTSFDIYVSGGSDYDPHDPEWPPSVDWEPSGGYLRSEVAGTLFDLGGRTGNLGTGSDLLLLAYACLLARELTADFASSSGQDAVGACCGFDGGGWIHLGWVPATPRPH